MIKESSNLVGGQIILVNNSKLIYEERTLLFSQISFNISLWIIFNNSPCWPLTIQILDKSGQNWAWLGMPGNTQPKTEVSGTNFPFWIAPKKKSKVLMHSFQRVFWCMTYKRGQFQIRGLRRNTKNCKPFNCGYFQQYVNKEF